MADGLLGVGSFLQGAQDAYWKQKQYDLALQGQENERKQLAARLAAEGFEYDPEGNLKRTKEGQRRRDLEELTTQAGILKSGYKAQEDPTTGKFALVKDPEFRDIDREYKKAQIRHLGAETQGLIAKGQPQTTEKKLAGLHTADKGRFDNLRFGLTALNQATSALNQGENTFSLVGDNPYTVAARQFEEALGRMQSGGAISKDEGVRFRAMLPGALDSPEVAAQKLASLQREFEGRLETLGFKRSDFPDLAEVAYSPAKKRGLLGSALDVAKGVLGSSSAVAAPKAAPSAEDQEAVAWAKANPKDPRAAQILKMHGM